MMTRDAHGCLLPRQERPADWRADASWLAARLGEPAALLSDVAWEELLTMLDERRVQIGFICGWSYGRDWPAPVDALHTDRDDPSAVRRPTHPLRWA